MDNLSRGAAFSLLLVWAGISGIFPANFISASEKIDINTASPEDLVKIIHIGEARSLELISLRPFSSLDDLARIKGIGPSRVEDIKKEGLAWVAIKEAVEDEAQQADGLVKDETQQYPEGIIFSEILPSPEGPDEENEWIELYNKNGFGVNLSGWQVKDEKGKIRTYTFPEEIFIEENQYLILPRTVSGIILNNEGDNLNLLQPNGQTADATSYGKAERGKSFNLVSGEWLWSEEPTPENPNSVILEKETVEAPSRGKAIAEISQKSFTAEGSEKKGSLSAGLIALLLASFSGIMILTIKKKSKLN